MDIFWVFILIFGIIVSIGQKASKQQAAEGYEGEPTLSPEEEMERRIRDLLEGKPATPRAPQPTHTEPATTTARPAPTTVRPTTTTARPASTTTVTRPAAATASARTATYATTPRKRTAAKPSPTHANNSTDRIKQSEVKRSEIGSSEIGRIIDDFTIEKGTIYAEIMHPKFKEY